MSIFRRNKDAARDADDAPTPDGPESDGDSTTDAGTDTDTGAPAGEPPTRADGPFDVEEVDGRGGRIDLGAMWISGAPGMELRLEVEQQTQQVNAVTAVIGDSAVQMQAFAAPRSSGLWTDIRREIAIAVEQQGGTVEEVTGPLGTELRTRMPSAGPDGRTVFAPATFLGVDGPRWFLRGVLSGRAAIDENAAASLIEVIKGVVVVRGVEPMAPREMLPLTLPQDARPETEAAAEDDDDDRDEDRSLDPFERGPEITEVR